MKSQHLEVDQTMFYLVIIHLLLTSSFVFGEEEDDESQSEYNLITLIVFNSF